MNTNNINDPPPLPYTNVGEDKKEGKNRKRNLKKKENKMKKKNEEKEEKEEKEEELIPGLPMDLFFKIIPLLDPFMIALCHLVCKSWRMTILLNCVFYAELDLSRLGIGVEDRIIQSFQPSFLQLCERANHRLVKVSLNMLLPWADYVNTYEVYEHTFTSQMFDSFLFASKKTLREISLVFELEAADFRKFNLSFFPFLNSILKQLLLYPLLDSICIKGPTGISFTLGSGRPKSRVFHIQDNSSELTQNVSNLRDGSEEGYQNPTFALVALIAELGKKFIGDQACFSYVFIDFDNNYLSPPRSLLDLLSDSIFSLKTLELGMSVDIGGSDLWSFVIQCTNLEALRLDLCPSIDADEPVLVELRPPQKSSINSNLKVFSLGSHYRYSIDWVLTSPWLGSNLTDLSLRDLPDGDGNYNLMKGPSDFISIFQNIMHTLTSVTLHDLHPRVEPEGATVKMLESMPNLKSLVLELLHPSFFDFFATSIVHPNLQTLKIQSGESSQSAFDCHLALLKANSSSSSSKDGEG